MLKQEDKANSISVLIVEDDSSFSQIIRMHLERQGISCDTAFTADECIRKLRASGKQLLLLDYRLPDMTAPELLENLRKEGIFPVFIIMTGYDDQKIALEMLGYGARNYVLKDKDLLKVIPTYVRRIIEEMENRRHLQVSLEKTRDMEEQLRHLQKVESLGLLVGSVGHDFNNIITAISGNVRMMSIKSENPVLKEYIDCIDELCIRAAALSSRLLLFGRKKSIHFTLVNVTGLLRQFLGMVQPLLGAEIKLVFEGGTEELVMADAGTIEQAVMNLIVNARDAMGGKGEIRIVTSDMLESERSISISVSDKGSGMDAATLEKVFQPFFTTKQEGQGTGLGLSIVQSIVQQHQGRIEVESDLGQGTRFTISLPVFGDGNLGMQDSFSGTVRMAIQEITLRQQIAMHFSKNGIRTSVQEDFIQAGGDPRDVILVDQEGWEKLMKSGSSALKVDCGVVLMCDSLEEGKDFGLEDNRVIRILKPFTMKELWDGMLRAKEEFHGC